MHISSFEIKNIRSITKLDWQTPLSGTDGGWHVIIGDNGAGKSTVLKSLALALIGPNNAEALRQDWNDWLMKSTSYGESVIWVSPSSDDHWSGKGKPTKNLNPPAGIIFKREQKRVELESITSTYSTPERHVWSDKIGWFSASFGPFRRFTGGDKDAEKLFYSHPRLARHLSVFGEDIALTECLSWLRQLRFEQLDKSKRSGELLEGIQAFVNQPDFLPHDVRFESVDSKDVRFIDGRGISVSINYLGDGFRSILSLTFELLRQITSTWPNSDPFTKAESGTITVKHSGVVMIDEIDAHLHPTWQRRIGFWLTKHFPKIQFIVTTHSPLVCHAAENGSIFRLPTPGSKEEAGMVTGIEKERLIFGSVLDAYGTELFGKDISRSKSAQKKQQRLATLNQKALKAPLSPLEDRERTSLRLLFPASM